MEHVGQCILDKGNSSLKILECNVCIRQGFDKYVMSINPGLEEFQEDVTIFERFDRSKYA